LKNPKTFPKCWKEERGASGEHIASGDPPAILPDLQQSEKDPQLDSGADTITDGCKSVYRDSELDKEMEF